MTALAVAAGIGGLMAGTSIYSSYEQAAAQNEYQEKAYAAQAAAIGAENRMIRDQETLEDRKAVSQARMIQARIRATAGESGLGFGGTYEALLRQSDYDTALNQEIIRKNAANRFMGQIIQPIAGQVFNPLISGITSGIGGFATGLSIGSDLEALKKAKE